jgi:hypothetical protein
MTETCTATGIDTACLSCSKECPRDAAACAYVQQAAVAPTSTSHGFHAVLCVSHQRMTDCQQTVTLEKEYSQRRYNTFGGRIMCECCRHYRGRGAFESLGAGLAMAPGDIAFKSNFATFNPSTGAQSGFHARCFLPSPQEHSNAPLRPVSWQTFPPSLQTSPVRPGLHLPAAACCCFSKQCHNSRMLHSESSLAHD